MTDRETLYDRVPADGKPLDLMRMRQSRDDSRPTWGWCFAVAALVIGALAIMGVV